MRRGVHQGPPPGDVGANQDAGGERSPFQPPPAPHRHLAHGLTPTSRIAKAASFKGAMGFVVLLTVVGGSIAYDLHNLSAMMTLSVCGLVVLALLGTLQQVGRTRPQLIISQSAYDTEGRPPLPGSTPLALSGTAPHTLSGLPPGAARVPRAPSPLRRERAQGGGVGRHLPVT